jgi:Raf kinase inhibitor-like YbhB/YbcL family protein
VVDIPATVTSLPENASAGELPRGAMQTVTDFGPPGYGGPSPPPGKPHRYIFTVYALKVARLGLKPKYPMATVDAAIHKQALAEASFTVTFGHP